MELVTLSRSSHGLPTRKQTFTPRRTSRLLAPFCPHGGVVPLVSPKAASSSVGGAADKARVWVANVGVNPGGCFMGLPNPSY